MSSTNNQTTTTRSRSTDDISDTTPLLSPTESNRSLRRQPLRDAARLLRRASSRRMMREPSMLVRETAAEQLEERQSDWAYSKPVVILDLIWNFAFVAAAAAVLLLSREEQASVPLRLWIVGYAAQCVLHMACVCAEYRRRRRMRRRRRFGFPERGSAAGGGDGNSSLGLRVDSGEYVGLAQLEEDNSRLYICFISLVN